MTTSVQCKQHRHNPDRTKGVSLHHSAQIARANRFFFRFSERLVLTATCSRGRSALVRLTPSLPRCYLKTTNKSAKCQTLKSFFLLFSALRACRFTTRHKSHVQTRFLVLTATCSRGRSAFGLFNPFTAKMLLENDQ